MRGKLVLIGEVIPMRASAMAIRHHFKPLAPMGGDIFPIVCTFNEARALCAGNFQGACRPRNE